MFMVYHRCNVLIPLFMLALMSWCFLPFFCQWTVSLTHSLICWKQRARKARDMDRRVAAAERKRM